MRIRVISEGSGAAPYMCGHIRQSIYSKRLRSGRTGTVQMTIGCTGWWWCTLAPPG